MVVGSGPIIIGQAAEFDYAGTQACRSLREEGCEVVLINSNPATIMTDTEIADKVYIEPLNVEFATRVIEQERPDGLLPTLGGQTGLNLAVELAAAGVLDKYHVKLLGTPLESIQQAEDRELFRQLMRDIGEPVPESWIITNPTQLRELSETNTVYPLIVRPAYTLGGTGGGIAHNAEELMEIGQRGLNLSMRSQIMVERSLLGWKEVEYEVMRDGADNCITVCNMENLDAMGIHTGDSIVVAPSQTLSDKEYQMLRTASLKIIRALHIEGGCNVQLALDPHSFQYCVIEVNPRVSRSSALASKATGYPIARVASKIAIGMRLDEIPNAVTKKTLACFEPALDYCVVKIPRWPFDKFTTADRTVGTQMKATGEVMAIDRTFESALMKAVRSLEIGVHSLHSKNSDRWGPMQIEELLKNATDERLFAIAQALRDGMMVEEIAALSNVDIWFLHKIKAIVDAEEEARTHAEDIRAFVASDPSEKAQVGQDMVRKLKRLGYQDRSIADFTGIPEGEIRRARKAAGIKPTFKMVDTCAAEFDAVTPYFYSCYEEEDEARQYIDSHAGRKRAIVIGSGPIRIGQGIEFDYCSVHSVLALKEAGYESIIINNNPETVSTDFDTSDRLYFEPLTPEDVLNIIDEEQPEGVIVQFGGQTAINLAKPLHEAGIRIFGSSFASIDAAEDRNLFERMLSKLDIPKPAGRAVTTAEEAAIVAEEIGYPVLVRPSYVLGGRAMEIINSRLELNAYMNYVVEVSPKAPILVDKYIIGKELEVDVISDGADCLIPQIMEHIERAGVHSGDSMAVCPPVTLSDSIIQQVVKHATSMARELKVLGMMNVQFVLGDDTAQVLEVNPRASRTVPYLSKITGVPMIQVATNIMLGKSLKEQGFGTGLLEPRGMYAVKAPVFSFAKLTEVDVALGPEMKSTGEIMGVDYDFGRALYKAMVASGINPPVQGKLIITLADPDKDEGVEIAQEFQQLGYTIYATAGTSAHLREFGVEALTVNKISEGTPNLLDLVRSRKVHLLINTVSRDKRIEQEGSIIRKTSVQQQIPCLTSLDTARALLLALKSRQEGNPFACKPIDQYFENPFAHMHSAGVG